MMTAIAKLATRIGGETALLATSVTTGAIPKTSLAKGNKNLISLNKKHATTVIKTKLKLRGERFKGNPHAPSNNPYKILGVKKGVSLSELKNAWLDGAARWHPDLTRINTNFEMAQINVAYETILYNMTR